MLVYYTKLDMTTQTVLKDKFISKAISEMDFLRELMKLDQSTLNRENCYENIKIMEDPLVVELFNKSDEDSKYDYYDYLRFFYFHAFQEETISKGITKEAKKFLENAVKISKTLQTILPNEDTLFAKYILGTLYYINEDNKMLKSLIEEYKQGNQEDFAYANINILYKLYKGLTNNNNADYKRDY